MEQHATGKLEVPQWRSSRTVLCPRHMLQYVVHSHHVRTRQCARQPEKMRHVNQVTIQAPQNSAKAEVPARGGVPLGESNIVEIRWQQPDLLNFFRSPNQVVLVFPVQS